MKQILNLLILTGAIALFIFVLNNCLQQKHLSQSESTSRHIGMDHSEALIRQNEDLLEAPDTDNGQQIRRNIKSILKHAPLNDDALFHYAAISTFEDQTEQYVPALLEAKKRNARNRRTIVSLYFVYRLNNDPWLTLNEIDLLMRLERKPSEIYYQELAFLFQTTDGRAAIENALERAPVWAEGFLKSQIKTADEASIEDLSELVLNFSQDDKKKSLSLREAYLKRLVQLNKLQSAYTKWVTMLDPSEEKMLSDHGLNYNPNFKNIKTPTPFNWFHRRNKFSVIEQGEDGGIFLSYGGKRPTIISNQYVKNTHAPTYQISFDFNSFTPLRNGKYEVRLGCVGSKKVYAAVILNNADKRSQQSLTLNEDTDDCPFFDMQLWAVPEFYSSRISAQLNSLSLQEQETQP